MKNADIVVNGYYFTKVSGAKVLVRVVSREDGGLTGWRLGDRKRPDTFSVERVDNGKRLTSRNAAALHLTRAFDAVDPGTGPRALDVTGKTVIHEPRG